MSFRNILVGAAMLLGIASVPANATVVYTLSGVDAFGIPGKNFGFSFTAANFITADAFGQVLDSCSIVGDTCTTADFDVSTNQFGGLEDLIVFKVDSSSSSGFLFFAQGALGAAGVYNSIGIPAGTPCCYGSFATAVLTVRDGTSGVVPLPAALPLLASGLGAFGLFGWRRKRTASST